MFCPQNKEKGKKKYLFTISYLTELSSKQTICFDLEKRNTVPNNLIYLGEKEK